MSDYDDFDDDFPVDEAFFTQVDNIAARAASSSSRAATSSVAPARSTFVLPRPSVATPAPNPANPPYCAPRQSKLSFAVPASPISRSYPEAGPSRRAAALGVRIPRPPPALSSDDFGDDVSFTAESLEQIDAASSLAPVWKPGSQGRARIPSSGIQRALDRTNSGGFQTHLNFRREQVYTKGKRWDRTAFAASGRRIGLASKKKGKGKGKAAYGDDDDAEEMDDEDDEPLAPAPKPAVDMNKPYGPQKHEFNPISITNYLYPTNRSKRDYQYEIIRACFTDNCLVALPTGLGKTFIAGVVMLNFYRWFPTGKIVFLAPTKPLVHQQIEACQLTCGIPSADAAVMTGADVTAKKREKMWDERRVFYCTPQTLDNDLKNGRVDSKDIMLVVFDEAHKASGSYAYTTILAYMTAHHPYFRVLALTATPGNDVEKVQGVVDALHISRIEIREAEAPEVRKYMNEKKTEQHVVPMGPIVSDLRDRWAAVMKPFIKKLVDNNILNDRDLDATRLKAFRVHTKCDEVRRSDNLRWAYGSLANLERMARAMAYLLEFSITMFHGTLLELAGNSTKTGKKGNSRAGANSLRNNVEFQRVLGDVESELDSIKKHRDGKTMADKHPKMQKTLELLLAHFAQAEEDEEVHGIKNDTRAMVFCSLREGVLDIVEMCNEHPDLLRATKFVGQSDGKNENDKGFNQKEQKRVIQEFKDGKFNVLVSTSIGEEGLDIGEVDFVVIYDMPKTSIKLLQRIGRTGRKRDGHVHVLMSEGREDLNWETALRAHRDIQEEILHSRNLELFEDVERLLPSGALPACIEQEMPIDPWDPADQKRKTKLVSAAKETKAKSATKKKRGNDIPDDAHEGFKSVAELLKINAKRKRKAASSGSSSSSSEVDEPMELNDEGEEDAANALMYGSVSSSRLSAKPKKKAAKKRPSPKTLTEARKQQERDWEKQEQARIAVDIRRKEKEAEERRRLSRQAFDFFNTQGIARIQTPSPSKSSPLRASPPTPVVDEDALFPAVKTASTLTRKANSKANGLRLSPRTAAAAGFSQIIDFADLSSDEDEDGDAPVVFSPPPRMSNGHTSMPPPPLPSSSPIRPCGVAFDTPLGATPAPIQPETPSTDTPFPVRLQRRRLPSSEAEPDGSPAVRPLQRLRRRRPSNATEEEVSPVAQRRQANGNTIGHGRTSRDERRQPRQPRTNGAAAAALMDLDAGVSGSDHSGDESSGTESESDRRFAGDFQPTQAPRGYNQRAVYAAGMMDTQACVRQGLGFAGHQGAGAGDDRRAQFFTKARKPVMVSDDERSSDNDYELGSFVCEDEDVAFMSQSDPLGSYS